MYKIIGLGAYIFYFFNFIKNTTLPNCWATMRSQIVEPQAFAY